jgi:excisionase family DNA binding protein
MSRLYRVSDLAARLDTSEWVAYDLIRRGKIPGVVRLGRAIRIDPVAVEEFIASGGTSEYEEAA